MFYIGARPVRADLPSLETICTASRDHRTRGHRAACWGAAMAYDPGTALRAAASRAEALTQPSCFQTILPLAETSTNQGWSATP